MAEIAETFIVRARSILLADDLPRIERCLEALSDEEIWWRANAQSNSIGNLVLHLAGNVRQWIVSGLGQSPDTRLRPQEFAERRQLPGVDLLHTLDRSLAEADAVLAAIEPARLLETRTIQGSEVTILEAVFHVVEHFSMHTGQIILLTKMLKGQDLRFYDFSGGAPLETWRQLRSEP